MPTPMPIIAATWGTKFGVVRTLAMMPTPARDTAIPMRAVRIGRPIAMRDPNATSKTTIAAAMPMTSLAGIAALGEPGARELHVDAVLAQRLRECSIRSAVLAG